MRKPFLIAMALAVAPFAAQAETWNIYGWQNHSWEFVDIDGGQSFDRIQSNAGNIGFAASVPTGMNDISVNVRCEQFTYFNHFAGGTGWCNRNSKIGLSHPQMGEIMFATWLLPYNEGVAQWVDPFYDAGADSHTSIMGSVGANTIFYNTGDFDQQASNSHFSNGFDGSAMAYDDSGFEGFPEFNYSGLAYDTGFNRRQENIIQYWSPNWNGFVFRFAWTAGRRDETAGLNGKEIDPVIRSSSLAYTNGPLWLAVTWQDHEDWTAASIAGADHGPVMETSDAESFRVAGRYIMDMGDGMSVQLSAMWEDLEYEFNGVVSVEQAMAAFGYGNFSDSGNLMESMKDNPPGDFMAPTDSGTAKLNYKTIGRLYAEAAAADRTEPAVYTYTEGTGEDAVVTYGRIADDGDSDTTDAQVSAPDISVNSDSARGNENFNIFTPSGIEDDASTEDVDESLHATARSLKTFLEAWGKAVEALRDSDDMADVAYVKNYDDFVASANADALPGAIAAAQMAHDSAVENYEPPTAGQNVKIERDAWMVSGKIKFGGPVDFRFSYMDADDLEVSCASCSGDWDETAADAWNVGLFYTMPAGTELRLTYSEVDNDDNGTYGQGISGTGLGTAGVEIEMFAVGIVHWFD